MLDWPNTGVYALGKIERLLGEAGDLTTEQEALLVNHGVTQIDFPPETLAELPSATPDESTWGDRRDLRDRCVFSIDPPTARDLDDALHILPLGPSEDFGYEVIPLFIFWTTCLLLIKLLSTMIELIFLLK